MKLFNNPETYKKLINQCKTLDEMDMVLKGFGYRCTINGQTFILKYAGRRNADFATMWTIGEMMFFNREGFDFEYLEKIVKAFLDAGNDFDNVINDRWADPLYTL